MPTKSWSTFSLLVTLYLCLCGLLFPAPARAQSFDFEKLQKLVEQYTVTVEMKIEVSFGVHTNEQEDEYMGTIVSADGLVVFNGGSLAEDNYAASFSGFTVKTTPTEITVTTLSGEKYSGEFIGVDRYSNIGFLKIVGVDNKQFEPLKLVTSPKFAIGQWLTVCQLLPEFVSPQIAFDIGMVSAVLTSPEFFPLTVGFNGTQLVSVIYDEQLNPVGVLGRMVDPSWSAADVGDLMDSFNLYNLPMLGVFTAERLGALIADPPEKGRVKRGWLGITLQALTPQMSDFWNLGIEGGIIVNDIVKNSPAESAGLKIGDIIYSINGQPVSVDREEKIPMFQRMISDMGPGSAVEFSVIRRGEVIDSLHLLATLEEAPMTATDAPEYENLHLEFKVRDLVFADYLFFNLDPESFSGVVVSELKQGGPANIGGLSIGDVIQRVNNIPVDDIDGMKSVMEELEEQQPAELIFFVWRNDRTHFVNVKTNW